MYKFFRDNQKKLMAVFGVVLMIAFIIPSAYKGGGGSNGGMTQGYIGKEEVPHELVQNAENEWDFLRQRIVVRNQGRPGEPAPQQQWISIAATQFPASMSRTMQEAPETYYLLQLEARKMGIMPDIESARQILNQPVIGIAMPDGSVVGIDAVTDPRLKAGVEQTMANFLMISAAFGRAIDAVKLSKPLLEHAIASQLQQVKSRVVDFQAKDYDAKVGQPSEAQLEEQFKAFGEVLPGNPTDANPFGVGYKYPNRVKLQYIGITHEQVRKAVLATKSEYDWEVEAAKYYQQHLDEFPAPPSTQPAPTTTPTDSFSLGGASTSKPTSQSTGAPKTRPFADVKQEAIDRVAEPLIGKTQRQIQSQITQSLSAAYDALKSGGSPTTAPASSASLATSKPTDATSYVWLQALAGDIGKKFNVTLTVGSAENSFRTADELRGLPGIGAATDFAEYAVLSPAQFAPASERNKPLYLDLYHPSRAQLTPGDTPDAYFFRLTAVDPSHKPASLSEVRSDVERDWARARALEIAKADAEKFAQVARSEGIQSAAAAAGKTLVTTGLYPNTPGYPIDSYSISTRAQRTFIQSTYALLGAYRDHPRQKPIAVIPLPPDSKVAVAELFDVQSSASPEMMIAARAFYTQQLRREYQQAISQEWFTYDAVAKRLGYKDATGRHTSHEEESAPAQASS